MQIRSYVRGDETAQVAIYNEAASELPKFKPASLDEVRRRIHAPDFDPTTRWYAVSGDRVVSYATFQPNGRVSYPWCLKGHEACAGPLFHKVVQEAHTRGLKRLFAAYRGDWPTILQFFQGHGFQRGHEMVNFVLDIVDMPTPAARPLHPFTPLTREDLPGLLRLGAGIVRCHTEAEAEQAWLANPWFRPESVFVLRGKNKGELQAAGVLIKNSAYAHPKQLDSAMPCFRLGAFGTEGLTTKRINGLFSLLMPPTGNMMALALDLLGHAALQMEEDCDCLAAQVPSDAAHLLRFYQHHFRRQGSFPVLERTL